MKNIHRAILGHIVNSLQCFPIVYLVGPRQSGKTTLVKHIASTVHKAQYFSFDDIQLRFSVKRDPKAFLKSIEGNCILDEIQFVPELFEELKICVDEGRSQINKGNGRFLLTGSASITSLPQLSQALVGRMAIHTLLPLSAHELCSGSETFIDKAFRGTWSVQNMKGGDIFSCIRKASFPELMSFESQQVYEWCNGYISTIFQRDVQALMDIEKAHELPRILSIFASRIGGLLNETALCQGTGLNRQTAMKYRALLEGLFMIRLVPAWSTNMGKRLIKSPKVFIQDINILSYLLKTDTQQLLKNKDYFYGQIIENFVAAEIGKQSTFSCVRADLYHYRTASGQEIDFILEGANRQVVALEVKAKYIVDSKDFHHIEELKKDIKDQFAFGYVLYLGEHAVPFGENLWALPMQSFIFYNG